MPSIADVNNHSSKPSLGSMALDMEINSVKLNSQKRRVVTELQIGVERSTDKGTKKTARQSIFQGAVQGAGAVAMTGLKISAVVIAGQQGTQVSAILDGLSDAGAKYTTEGASSLLKGREASLGGLDSRRRSNEQALEKARTDDQAFSQSHQMLDVVSRLFSIIQR